MIKLYRNGIDLWEENKTFLETNPHLSVFFRLDAPLLQECDRKNYAVCYSEAGSCALALKVEPYSLLIFGDSDAVPEILGFLYQNDYEMKQILCSQETGECIQQFFQGTYGISVTEELSMDYMSATEVTEPSSESVINAAIEDWEEICECLAQFMVDCGLTDPVNPEKVKREIGQYRLIKVDGIIVSMAKISPDIPGSVRICNVYTRKEFRGKKYARKVVNTIKNEILSAGNEATLNVDRKNPVSNHLYHSLGFRRVFSQGEFVLPEE